MYVYTEGYTYSTSYESFKLIEWVAGKGKINYIHRLIGGRL